MDKDEYEAIVFQHDFQKDTISKALELVKMYILSNKLILTGGMAIDLALRSKGSKLYPDDKLPDYDFYSPTFHIHAYQLGEQLMKAGLPNISVIRAVHVSTMRVRVNFVTVADITYIPQNIYDIIPTINYQGFRIVHPNYQMIDQHRALSIPFENPPLETIMDRWKKDITRYDLLNKDFPIILDDIKHGGKHNKKSSDKHDKKSSDKKLSDDSNIDGDKKANKKSIDKKLSDKKLSDDSNIDGDKKANKKSNDKEVSDNSNIDGDKKANKKSSDKEVSDHIDIQTSHLQKQCLSGACALHYWLNKAKDDGIIISDYDYDKGVFKATPELISVNLPKDLLFTITTDNFEEMMHLLTEEKKTYYNATMNKIPRRIVLNTFELLDNRGRLLSAYFDQELNIHISNLQDVMCYLLTLGSLYANKNALKLYTMAQKLLFTACEKYKDAQTDTEKRKWMIYLPTTNTYGQFNWSESNIIAKEEILVQFHLSDKELKTPKNLHPVVGKPINKDIYNFQPEKSTIYQYDNLATKPFTLLNLPE